MGITWGPRINPQMFPSARCSLADFCGCLSDYGTSAITNRVALDVVQVFVVCGLMLLCFGSVCAADVVDVCVRIFVVWCVLVSWLACGVVVLVCFCC